MKIKKQEYKKAICSQNPMIVCPYCQSRNTIINDMVIIDKHVSDYQCGQCDHMFSVQTNVSITFNTEPYENYYLKRKEQLLRKKKEIERKQIHDQLTQNQYNNILEDLNHLNEKAKKNLGG